MRVIAPAAAFVAGGHALTALPASTRHHGPFKTCRASITENQTTTNEPPVPIPNETCRYQTPRSSSWCSTCAPPTPGVPAGRGVIRPRCPTMAWSLPNVEPRFAGTRTPNHNDVIVRHSKNGEQPLVTSDEARPHRPPPTARRPPRPPSLVARSTASLPGRHTVLVWELPRARS